MTSKLRKHPERRVWVGSCASFANKQPSDDIAKSQMLQDDLFEMQFDLVLRHFLLLVARAFCLAVRGAVRLSIEKPLAFDAGKQGVATLRVR